MQTILKPIWNKKVKIQNSYLATSHDLATSKVYTDGGH